MTTKNDGAKVETKVVAKPIPAAFQYGGQTWEAVDRLAATAGLEKTVAVRALNGNPHIGRGGHQFYALDVATPVLAEAKAHPKAHKAAGNGEHRFVFHMKPDDTRLAQIKAIVAVEDGTAKMAAAGEKAAATRKANGANAPATA